MKSFNMFKDKILFIFDRCEYNNNKILISKNFSFLSFISFIVITRFFKLIVKNESDENSFDINFLKDISNKKKSISIFKTFKERIIKKLDLINIIKINASTYYHLIRNKKNKFFFLTINKIYNILYESSLLKTI